MTFSSIINVPLVSVVIAAYNGGDYLLEAFDSIKKQTYDNIEIIIVNDASTDNTFYNINMFDKKFDKSIRIITHYTNKGVATSRNEAIDMAEGKYIAIQDADDVSLSTRIEKQVNFLESSDCFCVGSHAFEIDKVGEIRRERIYPPATHEEIIDIIMSMDTFYLNPIIDPSTMFSKEVFWELGGYNVDPEFRFVQDYDLWAKAIINDKKIANLQEKLIYYRTNPKGVTIKNKKIMIKQHMTVWHKLINSLQGLREKNSS